MNEQMIFLLLSLQGIAIITLGSILWVVSDHQDKTIDELHELRRKVGV